jgi:hypothetical protein
VTVGAAATKSGRPSTAGWVGPGERDGKVYARNRCCYASSRNASSNPVDVGWFAVQTRLAGRAGNFWSGIALRDREATVKVYGVAVAMPQG